MSFYHRFKILTNNPFWRWYLRWVYPTAINDFNKLGFIPDFNRKGFRCLLCGVANEITTQEYLEFVRKKNQNAKVVIIDLGQEQIEAVSKLVSESYGDMDITVKRMNALELEGFIENGSLDWIETDGFLQYFEGKKLGQLLKIWHSLLKKNGFVTTRAMAHSGGLDVIFERIKIWFSKTFFNAPITTPSRQKLEGEMDKAGFKFVVGFAPLPNFRRYSLIKK